MSHPVHPAIVHFPIACWSLATLGDLTSMYFGEQVWWMAGVLHIIGTSIAIVAMISGLIEFAKIDEKHAAFKTANLHMILAVSSWSVYATTLFLRLDGTSLTAPNLFETGLSLFGFLILSATGWLGGKLVYEHEVGINTIKHNKV